MFHAGVLKSLSVTLFPPVALSLSFISVQVHKSDIRSVQNRMVLLLFCVFSVFFLLLVPLVFFFIASCYNTTNRFL